MVNGTPDERARSRSALAAVYRTPPIEIASAMPTAGPALATVDASPVLIATPSTTAARW